MEIVHMVFTMHVMKRVQGIQDKNHCLLTYIKLSLVKTGLGSCERNELDDISWLDKH